MNKLFAIGALVAAAAGTAPALAADVGVSVHISQPGVYGRVDIGRFPQPQVLVAQPVVVYPRPVTVVQAAQPVYMWVPPGHRRNWPRYCGAYNACGVPVYFVQDQWYEQHVRPVAYGQHDYRHQDRHEDKHKYKRKHEDGDEGKGHGGKGKHDD